MNVPHIDIAPVEILAAWLLGGFVVNWHNSRTIKQVQKENDSLLKHAADPYEAQINQLTEQSRGFYQMQEEQKNIGLYLRDHYRDEIALGHHTGRSLDSIIIGYLSRERKLTKEEWTA